MKTLTFPGCEKFTAIRFLPVRPMRKASKKFRDIRIYALFNGGMNLLPLIHPADFRIGDLYDGGRIDLVPYGKDDHALGFIESRPEVVITVSASDEIGIRLIDDYRKR